MASKDENQKVAQLDPRWVDDAMRDAFVKPGTLVAPRGGLSPCHDYDELMRDMPPIGDCHRDYDISSDSIIITGPTGKKYRITTAQSEEYERWGTGSNPTPTPQPLPNLTERVHITHRGSPLCGFTDRRPVEWPQGHTQASVDAYKQGAKITCHGCYEAFNKLFGHII